MGASDQSVRDSESMKDSKCDSLLLPPLLAGDTEKGGFGAERRPVGWRCMPFILGNEGFEKVASYGLTANMTMYLMERYGMKQVEAAKLGNVFAGTTNFTPLLGGFVADAYWGRFRTLALGSMVSFLGMVSWTVTSLIPQLQPPICNEGALQSGQCLGPTKMQLGFLFFSMGLLSLGAGGVRPCSLPFGADQFDCTTEQGKRGLTSYFNWCNCIICSALVISMTVVVYIQDTISWSLGFSIPTVLMLLAIIFFFIGSRLYVYVAPEGSVFSSIAQVFVVSFRKRNLRLPYVDGVEQQESMLYDPPISNKRTIKLPLSQQFRLLNKAAIRCEGESSDGSPANTWRLCSIQQIEEVKCLIRIIPIWASGIICFLAITQQWSFVVLQSLKMDRNVGPNFQIPAGSMSTVGLLSLIMFIPAYDRILVPALRSITKEDGGITLLQRQGIGIFISTLSMVVAAMVERKRRDSALSHDGVSPMSVMWLVPQLVLMGVGEALNAIGQMEFYNRQFPESMQTLAGSLVCFSQALASYMTNLLVSIIQKTTGGGGGKSWFGNDINDGKLDYYYYVIASMGGLNMLYFILCARFYRYKGM